MAMNSNSPKSVCNAMSNIEFAKSLRKYDRIEVSHIIDLKIRLSSFNRNFSFALAMVEAMALHKLRLQQMDKQFELLFELLDWYAYKPYHFHHFSPFIFSI
jgi:hypothetical protein